jgi:hypothetical protein
MKFFLVVSALPLFPNKMYEFLTLLISAEPKEAVFTVTLPIPSLRSVYSSQPSVLKQFRYFLRARDQVSLPYTSKITILCIYNLYVFR